MSEQAAAKPIATRSHTPSPRTVFRAANRAKLAAALVAAKEGQLGTRDGAGRQIRELDVTDACDRPENGIVLTGVTDNADLKPQFVANLAPIIGAVRAFGNSEESFTLFALLEEAIEGFEIAGWRIEVPATSKRPTLRNLPLDGPTVLSLLSPEMWRSVSFATLDMCPDDQEPGWITVTVSVLGETTEFQVRAAADHTDRLVFQVRIGRHIYAALDRNASDIIVTPAIMQAAESFVIAEFAADGQQVAASGVW